MLTYADLIADSVRKYNELVRIAAKAILDYDKEGYFNGDVAFLDALDGIVPGIRGTEAYNRVQKEIARICGEDGGKISKGLDDGCISHIDYKKLMADIDSKITQLTGRERK